MYMNVNCIVQRSREHFLEKAVSPNITPAVFLKRTLLDRHKSDTYGSCITDGMREVLPCSLIRAPMAKKGPAGPHNGVLKQEFFMKSRALGIIPLFKSVAIQRSVTGIQ